MTNLFGVNIANIVATSIAQAGGVHDVTLIKIAQGTRTPGQLSGGSNPTETQHPAKGFEESLSVLRPETIVQDARAVVTILGDTITGGAVPVAGDSVISEGTRRRIVGPVNRDPARAVYQCQVT